MPGRRPSLSEVHASIPVPQGGIWLRRFLAFAGPGYMISVGYMDPGNWATDIAGGSRFGYTLLSVILLSNLMAILLQALAARLGIATGRDLAQACRDSYSRPVNIALWLACEAAIIACDLAEVIGTAIALQLLFGIPLIAGALITALDAFLLLLLMNRGFRFLEAFIIALLIVIAGCFAVQIVAAAPPVAAMLAGFLPSREIVTNPAMLYVAIGIIGATVMPHNLYLHSSIVQTRAFERTDAGRRQAIRWATADGTIALMLALFVNAAILVIAATAFHASGHADVAEIGDAYRLLSPLLGLGIASVLFAVALLASGLNSTVTATLAGQIVMEGFLRLRLPELGAAADHPRHRHRPRRRGDRAVWRKRDGGTAGVQPGDPVDATAVRGHPARAVRLRPPQDGPVRHPAFGCGAVVGGRRDHRRAQRQAAVRHGDRARLISPNGVIGAAKRARSRRSRPSRHSAAYSRPPVPWVR